LRIDTSIQKFKVRLVAKGLFKQEGIFFYTHALVSKITTIILQNRNTFIDQLEGLVVPSKKKSLQTCKISLWV
jgi:hypothetical protein